MTKSGSNAFHGTVFEFHRNDASIPARMRVHGRPGRAGKPDFRWNQFGYTATGPIFKNRVFFMSNYEGYKDNKTFLNNFTVPTVAMRSGDFSALHTAPRSGDLHRHRLEPACQPFAGNRIPTNRIDPISQQLLEFYPEPNAAARSTTTSRASIA